MYVFQKLGIELVNRGFELRSFLSKYNGIGISKLKNNSLKYYPHNPTVKYPIDGVEKKLIFASSRFVNFQPLINWYVIIFIFFL